MSLKPVQVSTSAFPERAGVVAPTALVEATSMRQSTLTEDNSDATCPACGETFASSRGVKIHHKKTHGESIAGVAVECANCGDKKTVFPKRAEDYDRHFCSNVCKSEWMSENRSGEDHYSWNGGLQTVNCDNCGEPKRVKNHVAQRDRHFCDQECWGQWASDNLSGSDSHAWEGGLVEVECEVCSETKEVKPHRADQYDEHFCEDCRSEWAKQRFSGEDNPRWTGGADVYRGVVALLSDRPWSDIAAEVRERDGECRMCGASPDDKELDVHHIIPVRSGGTHHADLLMTLCRSCHMKAESHTSDLPGMEAVLTE